MPNDPAAGVPCHGLPASGAPVATLTPGATVKATTSYGAGHGGGHCAWYISTKAQTTWYKISETADCTSQSVDGQRDDFVVPSNAPAECATAGGCVLGWMWSPLLSGSCETYTNCWDVSIPGATGGMETSAPAITTPIAPCMRVDPVTHLTPMFGAAVGANANANANANNPISSQVNQPDPGYDCQTYTVKSGDTLSAIAALYDVTGGYQTIFELNKDTMLTPNAIEVGQVLKMPGGDCVKDGESTPTTPTPTMANGLTPRATTVKPGEGSEPDSSASDFPKQKQMTGAASTFLVFWLLTTAAFAAHVAYMRREGSGSDTGRHTSSPSYEERPAAAATAAAARPQPAPRRPPTSSA